MRRIKFRQDQRGDTLVEVLLATVVLSIVLAGAFSLSNRALRLNQTATERTEVVNKMREQTEMLQFIAANRDTAGIADIWDEIDSKLLGVIGGVSDEFFFDIFVSPGDPNSGLVDLADVGLGQSILPSEFVVDYDGAVTVNGLPRDSYTNDLYSIRIYAANIEPEFADFVIEADWEGIGGLGTQEAANVLRIAR